MGLFSKKPKEKAGPIGQATLSDGQVVTVAHQVDCLGDSCPRPQLATKKAVGNAVSQEVVEVLVDNPTSMEALPPMCPAMAATHLETVSGDKGWHVYIRKD